MENKKLENIVFLPCIHFLCSECNNCLKKNECPFCRNKITEDPDSYDEHENEYNDVEFEILVMEDRSNERKRRKKYKKYEKKIMKLINNNQEIYISIDSRNTYTVLNQENLE
jgi:hypothetical protein